jgi:hypothetical protein
LNDEVKSAEKKKDTLMSDLKDAQNILAERCNWINVFNELQLKIPDTMWLVSIAPGKDPNAGAAASAPGEGGEAVVMPIFARRAAPRGAPSADAGKLEWLEAEGYFFGSPSEIDNFKQELAKTSIFTDKPAEIATTSWLPAREDDKNGFNSFKIVIKLKTPFIR